MITVGEVLLYSVSYFGLFTSVFFLWTMLANCRQWKNPTPPKVLPKVSVIVPACNEERTLAKTVDSLLGLDYPKEKFEIIIVDDGSVDNTLKVARKFEKRGVIVLTKPNGGKGTALNLGLKRATGEFVGCLDADSVVDADALKKMLGYFANKEVMAVTPSLKCTKPRTVWQRIQVIEFLLGVYLRKVFAFLGAIHVTPGPFTIFRKSFFDKYGGYDISTVTEDIEISLRMQANHYVIENAADANVYAIPKPTFKTLYHQRIRWYRGFLDNVHKYRVLFSKKYGNLGLFILPSAFISVFFAIAVVAYTLFRLVDINVQRFINLYSVNFDVRKLIYLRTDPFYIDASSLMFIGIVALFLSIVIIYLAKIISNEQEHIKWYYLLFILLYLPLFAFWWVVAIFYKTRKGNVVWTGRKRDEKEEKYLS
ncbi:glycosyltransferase family 2 protein [Candidatus Woesearchaeota archaeon]|nr:glycosyltransferase family 2 protein [Candidatus Woesearchaeota archaeon]